MSRIEVTRGERLALDWTPPARPRSLAVLFLHGLGSHKNGEKALDLDRRLREAGHGSGRFDFRGHGESSGRLQQLTLSRHLEDLHAVLDHLSSLQEGPLDWVLVGSSLGGLTAAWYSALHPQRIAGQVLLAPAFRSLERHLESVGEAGRRQWEADGRYRFQGPWFEFELGWETVLDGERYPAEELWRSTRTPTWILHGEQDESVPIALSEEFARECRAVRPKLIRVPGGAHRLTAHKPRIWDVVSECLAQVGRPA